MRFTSYWHDTARQFTGAADGEVDGRYDVAIVGGGFTGLSAACHLAKGGARVVVLEAATVGSGASGRNGGHVNNGLAHSYLAAKAELGADRARALYRALDSAVDAVEALVMEEGIDCAFRRSGKLKLALKPRHFEAIARNYEAINAEVDPDTALLSKAELAREIGSSCFHGGMLSRKSAMMHMGGYVTGLAETAVRHGATVFEGAAVTGHRREAGRHALTTGKRSVTAQDVLLATGAYTTEPFSYFRRRIVPVGSFLIATRPLSEEEARATLPGHRNFTTSMNIGNYFRLSPDNRLIFGGRARFSATSDQSSDARSGAILRENLARLFPQLKDIRIDYCWGGLVDMTKDRFPRAGVVDGVHYAMGYSGHGAQMSTYMGQVMADILLGRADRNPMANHAWDAIPGHAGKPWFLPLVGLYYRVLDKVR